MINKASYDDNDVFRDHKIKGLTEFGYWSLDFIRNDEVWNLIKEQINNFDELSIYSIFDIARKFVNVRQNELLGLPKDLIIQNCKW